MMDEVQACEIAFESFMRNHATFLSLTNAQHPELACEMILLELCATMHLLEDHSRKLFFEDILKIKEKIQDERFEDEQDFLDCVAETMQMIRKNHEN